MLALAVGSYGESNAEEYERSAPTKTDTLLTVDMLQSANDGIKKVAEAQTAHAGTSASHAMDHIASHNAPNVQKHRTPFRREGGPSAGGQ